MCVHVRLILHEGIISYVKNYFAVNFRIDYVNADGNISNYYPDFIVKTSPKEICIVHHCAMSRRHRSLMRV